MPDVPDTARLRTARLDQNEQSVQSELPGLKWADIGEPNNRFKVHLSPKTKKSRWVPLFPEDRIAINELRPITGGSRFVLGRLRETSDNWRTPLEKLLMAGGAELPEPPFNSLRSSAEMDLASRFGLRAATDWCGHSMTIALKNYLRTTDAVFQQAANRPSSFVPKAVPESAGTQENPAEQNRSAQDEVSEENAAKCRFINDSPTKKEFQSDTPKLRVVDDIGLEPTTSTMSTWSRCSQTPVFAGVLVP